MNYDSIARRPIPFHVPSLFGLNHERATKMIDWENAINERSSSKLKGHSDHLGPSSGFHRNSIDTALANFESRRAGPSEQLHADQSDVVVVRGRLQRGLRRRHTATLQDARL